jgi:predicted RNase H-like nuclease (RuvC/YqgF family)
MEEIIEKISSDPMLLLSSAIGIVIILFVVLVVVIANMRIKTYKERYINTRIDNEEKDELVLQLRQELKILKIQNTQNEQELQQFEDMKKRLNKTTEMLSVSQTELAESRKIQKRTQAKLEDLQNRYTALEEELTDTKVRFETLQDENNKLRVNNSRLLMKLDTEERLAMQLQQRNEKH